jgi:predicted nuclease of predicted toxin-antitoxin system
MRANFCTPRRSFRWNLHEASSRRELPPGPLQALRQAGLDVLWIAETHPGAPDEEVLALCISTNRTLLTFDKDFGELAYKRGLPAECGIVLFRITPQNPDEIAALALLAIQSQSS